MSFCKWDEMSCPTIAKLSLPCRKLGAISPLATRIYSRLPKSHSMQKKNIPRQNHIYCQMILCQNRMPCQNRIVKKCPLSIAKLSLPHRKSGAPLPLVKRISCRLHEHKSWNLDKSWKLALKQIRFLKKSVNFHFCFVALQLQSDLYNLPVFNSSIHDQLHVSLEKMHWYHQFQPPV